MLPVSPHFLLDMVSKVVAGKYFTCIHHSMLPVSHLVGGAIELATRVLVGIRGKQEASPGTTRTQNARGILKTSGGNIQFGNGWLWFLWGSAGAVFCPMPFLLTPKALSFELDYVFCRELKLESPPLGLGVGDWV